MTSKKDETVDIDALNPDTSGTVTIDNVEWSNITNFLYSVLVDCSDPLVLSKFSTMPVSELRDATRVAMDADLQKIVNSALEVAYEEKFSDPDMSSILLKTGSIKLKTPMLSSISSLKTAPLEEATELMKIRTKLAKDMDDRNFERDQQAYIRRVKQAVRIKKAMIKMLYEGNSLERFKHFSIASIPTELAHSGDAAPESIDSVAPEIKSAALSLNGNILYNLVRREELRKYRDSMIKLKGSVAKNCVATYILNSKYPHFYKEAVSKHTGDLKSKINSIRLSLENSFLDTSAKRELVDALERTQNDLRDKKSKLTKPRVYKKHAELLNTIPRLDEKVWQLYTQKKFPDDVQTSIAGRVNRLYQPTDLDIERAEGWTHRCQEFKRGEQESVKIEAGEYVISEKDFPELSIEYELRIHIDGKCFSSVAHFILFRLLENVLCKRFDKQTSELKAEQSLLGVTGKFIGIGKGRSLFLQTRDEIFEILMRNACDKGLTEWIKSSPAARHALRNHTGEIHYKSLNIILGIGPLGSDVRGLNLVGKTLNNIRRLI
jgi:hypothetical protein